MSIDSVLGAIGIWVLSISALALGVERTLDVCKMIFKKHLRREQPPLKESGEADSDFEAKKKTHLESDEAQQQRVRIIAIPIGIVVAILAEVDTLDMLGFPTPLWFGYPILGWSLSGLAASRGSAFWHDVIEVVRVAKEAKRDVAAAVGGK